MEEAREGGMNQLLLVHSVIKIICMLTLHQHYTEQHFTIQAISKWSDHIQDWTLLLMTITMASSWAMIKYFLLAFHNSTCITEFMSLCDIVGTFHRLARP